MRTLLIASSLAAATAACTPYDPDLGQAPFRCGPVEQTPRCPDGYTCVPGQGSNAPELCIINGGSSILPDSGNSSCADDSSLEPNDTTATAWVSPIDTGRMNIELAALAICPAGDKDNYSVTISTANRNLEMIIEYEAGGAELQGAILNSSGISIGNAVMTAANTKRAYTPNLPMGTYYVQVSGPASGSVTTNDYQLTINATGP